MYNREELAWAAGFFDGEGNIRFDPRPGRKNGWTQFQIAQQDRQVLDRFVRAVGFGSVYGPYGPYGKTKPYHLLSIQGFEYVQAAAAILWPWLSPVKKQQVKKALEAARVYKA